MAANRETIALFYDGYEAQANDVPFGGVKSDIRGWLRQTYRRAKGVQAYTGFYTAFLNLKRSLEEVGMTVRVNDFAYARAHPDMLIGLCGFASVYDKVRLPNPAMFGPGFVPPPDQVEQVVEACNLNIVTLPSEWACRMWRPVLGDRAQPMFVGIDTDQWPDLSRREKTVDVAIYDKIRWHRDQRVPQLLDPLIAHLNKRGLSHVVLRYGDHHLSTYRETLARTKSMVFLAEHETQGIAYQEAMSSGVPILAWDEGELVDPTERAFAPEDLVVSSVPYFDARCGHKFTIATLVEAFDTFWDQLGGYDPRGYVIDEISLERGAHRYLDLRKQAVGGV